MYVLQLAILFLVLRRIYSLIILFDPTVFKSRMFAEKGSFIYEKMYALVTNLNHRAQRVKEVLVRCPTPSSANSEQSRSEWK